MSVSQAISETPASASPSLADLLTHERELYTKHNPQSLALFQKAKNALPGGNTRTVLHYSPFPVVLKKAQDANIQDVDEHWYQDFLGEYTAGLYGHSHPEIINAVSGPSPMALTFGGPTEREAQLAAINLRTPLLP
jgi:Glutamate-1-semialdehyde aminotransferase